MLFQIFLIAFSAFAILRTSKQYREKKVSVYWFAVWTLFWVLVIFVAISPETTDVIATRLGVERGADLLVYTAVVFLAYAVYRILITLERQNQEITNLVREVALLEAERAGEVTEVEVVTVYESEK